MSEYIELKPVEYFDLVRTMMTDISKASENGLSEVSAYIAANKGNLKILLHNVRIKKSFDLEDIAAGTTRDAAKRNELTDLIKNVREIITGN